MALIEKTEFHLVEGEDYYDGESVNYPSLEEVSGSINLYVENNLFECLNYYDYYNNGINNDN